MIRLVKSLANTIVKEKPSFAKSNWFRRLFSHFTKENIPETPKEDLFKNTICCSLTNKEIKSERENPYKIISCSGGIRKGSKSFFGWMFSGLAIALIPKCPFCVAAYIAFAMGISVSFTTASYLRGFMLLLCGSALIYFILKFIYHFIKNFNNRKSTERGL